MRASSPRAGVGFIVLLIAGWGVAACGSIAPGPIESGLGCQGAPRQPAPPPLTATTAIVQYPVPGLGGIQPVVTGPDGNLWFVGGRGGPPNGLTEVVGRMTPSGQTTIYALPGNPGESFDSITAGSDGNLWFTEGAADAIGRLAPATGGIDTFPVPIPPPPASSQPRNTQTTDITAGPDGNLWFDVDQIAGASVMPDGYVGRITPTGIVTLFEVPGGGQPEGIQVGGDGNLWSRIAASEASSGCLPGYTPTAGLVMVTPAAAVTELSEDSPQFAGCSVGPDDDCWWMTSAGRMRRTTASGQVKDFPAFTTLGFWDPAHLVFGSDKNIWYVDGSNVMRMTLAGDVTRYQPPGANSGATWITTGPDGRLWFVEGASGRATIGAIRPPAQ